MQIHNKWKTLESDWTFPPKHFPFPDDTCHVPPRRWVAKWGERAQRSQVTTCALTLFDTWTECPCWCGFSESVAVIGSFFCCFDRSGIPYYSPLRAQTKANTLRCKCRIGHPSGSQDGVFVLQAFIIMADAGKASQIFSGMNSRTNKILRAMRLQQEHEKGFKILGLDPNFERQKTSKIRKDGETPPSAPQPALTVDDFEIIDKIGHGQFGSVNSRSKFFSHIRSSWSDIKRARWFLPWKEWTRRVSKKKMRFTNFNNFFLFSF